MGSTLSPGGGKTASLPRLGLWPRDKTRHPAYPSHPPKPFLPSVHIPFYLNGPGLFPHSRLALSGEQALRSLNRPQKPTPGAGKMVRRTIPAAGQGENRLAGGQKRGGNDITAVIFSSARGSSPEGGPEFLGRPAYRRVGAAVARPGDGQPAAGAAGGTSRHTPGPRPGLPPW